MTTRACDLRNTRAKLIHDARKLNECAETEKRDLTPEELESFEKMMAEVEALKQRIDRIEQLEKVEPEEEQQPQEEQERSRPRGIALDNRTATRGIDTPEYRSALHDYLRRKVETRDLSVGNDASGGYLVTPTRLSDTFVVSLNNAVFMRQLATVEQVGEAKNLGVRTLTADPSDPDWTAEVPVSDLTPDSTMAVGRRDLYPQLLTKLVKVSHRAVTTTSDIERLVLERLAYKFAVAQEKGFISGSGSSQPLGIFTASASGISTGRDVTCGSTTAISADGLFDMKYGLAAQYRQDSSLGWVMHRDARKQIAKLKDEENRYLLQPSLHAGEPDTVLGIPVYESEYAPNTFSASQYVIVLGNFKYYHIAELDSLSIQRADELFAAKNQIGFFGRYYGDAAPVLEAAFVRGKLAAS